MDISDKARATLESIAKACAGGENFTEYVHGKLLYDDNSVLDDMRELAAAGLVANETFSNGTPCYTGLTDAGIRELGLKDC